MVFRTGEYVDEIRIVSTLEDSRLEFYLDLSEEIREKYYELSQFHGCTIEELVFRLLCVDIRANMVDETKEVETK